MTETAAPYAVEGEVIENRQLTIPTDWLQPNGLTLPADLTEGEWEDVGWSFLFLGEVEQWAIGDWYNTGVARFKARTVTRFLERLREQYPYLRLTKVKLKTIRNYASACNTFPLLSRKWEHLSFWHYYKVCGYIPEERTAHLEHANTMEMSPAQFEAYLGEQDERRQKGEDREQRAEELAADNGRLQDENRALSDTVDYMRDDLDEARAQATAAEAEAASLRQQLAGQVCPECGGRLVCRECGGVT